MTEEQEAKLAELAGAKSDASRRVQVLGFYNTSADPVDAAKQSIEYGVAQAKLTIASAALDSFIRARVAEATA